MAAVTFDEPLTEDQRKGGLRTRFLESLLGYAVRRASNSLSADFAKSMEGTGMRPVLVSILAVVEENPGVNQGAIGRALGVARANMAPLMNDLEERKLLRRMPDKNDRRAVSVYLRKEGEAVLKECKTRILAQEKRALKNLTASEQSALLKLLNKI